MAWRARQDGDRRDPESAVADMIAQLDTGSATAESRLTSTFLAGDDEQRDDLLNALASLAATGSPYGLELLLALVTEYRLAAPAIGRHVQSHAVIEEVEQEVLIAVSRSIHRFRGEAKFTTWLYALARNTAISELRKQKPTAVIEDDQVDDPEQRRVSSLIAERDMVRAAVYSLPPIFRETVLLRDVDRLSYSEIAERQGLAINTVRSRLSRGRALLAAQLPEQQPN